MTIKFLESFKLNRVIQIFQKQTSHFYTVNFALTSASFHSTYFMGKALDFPFSSVCFSSLLSPSVLRPEGPRWKLEWCPHPAASLSLLHQALYVALPLGNPCRAPEAHGSGSRWRICPGGRSLRALWRWRQCHSSGGCTWRSLRSWQSGDVTDAVGLLTPHASIFFFPSTETQWQ